MNLFYANGTPVINSLKIQSEVPLDPRLNPETIEERDSLVTKHIAYDRMKVYVKETDSEYVYHKDKNEWVILSKFEKEEKDKLENIKNYLVDTEIIYDKDNNLLYREHSYDPNTNITSLRDYSIPEATVLGDGTLYNGLLSKFYVNRLNNVTGYQTDAKITSDTETESLFLTVTKYNPDTDESVTTNLNIPLVTDDNNGLVSPEKKHWMDNADGLSNTGTTSQTWQLQKSDIDTRLDPNGGVIIKNSGGKLEVRNNQDNSYAPVTLGDIIIEGNVTQKGESFITQAETVEVRDNTILLNRGETAAGVSKGFAGIEIDRGTLPKFQILFDESDRRFKAGEEGDLWCLALRDDDADMLNGMFTSWDSATKRLKTTNIIPSDRKLAFTDNNSYLQLISHSFSGDALSQTLRYSNSLGGIFISAGNTNLNLDTDKTSFYFHKNILLPSTISSVSDFLFKRSDVTKLSLKDTVAQFTVPVTAITFNRASDGSEVLYHADIINDLTSGGTNKVLSAEQGKLLQNSITSIQGSYLPLSGGTMTGSITFPNRKGIFGRLTDGTSNIKIAVVNANNNVEIGNSNTPLMLVSNSTDLTHYRDNNTYKIWDKFNLSDPATLSGNNTFTGNNTFQAGKFNVGPLEVLSTGTLLVNITASAGSGWSRSVIFEANSDNTSKSIFGGCSTVGAINTGWAYIGIGDVNNATAQYKFRPASLEVPIAWSLDDPNGNALVWSQSSTLAHLGRASGTTKIRSGNTDLIHTKGSTEYIIWDKSNLPNPATSTDLTNYLPLIGGTLTGQLIIKQSIDIKLRLQSTDADNYCIIQAINAQASQLGVFGYAGDKWAIGHGGTYYEIWDKYNLANPVTYIADENNYATLKNKDGNNFTYIKTGVNGILPSTAVNLTSGGYGSLGSNNWSFDTGYINHLHTNKISFGTNGAFIDNQSGDSSRIGIGFYNSNNSAASVYMGSLCVSDSYAADGQYKPTNGIYSKGHIRTGSAILFLNNTWTNDLAPNRSSAGYLQVLDAYNASSDGGPTNYGTVLQINSRIAHWANQLWFSSLGLYHRHMAYNQTEYGDWTKLATTSDLGNYLPLSGGTITSSGLNPVFINSTSGQQSALIFHINSSLSAAVGGNKTLGAFLQDGSDAILTVKSDGAYYGVNTSSLRKLATVTDLNNYLPLTGGNLTGKLSIKSSGSNLLILDSSSSTESAIHFLRSSTKKGAVGYYDNIGAFIYNFPSNTYLFVKDDGKPYVGTKTNYKKILTETDITGYATQSWVNNQGYLTSHQTIYNLTFQAGTFAAKTFDPNGAAATVNIPTNTSHLTNDSGFITSSALSGYATTSDLNSLSGSVISVTTGINYIPVNLPAAVRTSAGAKKYLEWYDAEPGWYNFRLGYIDANGTISATGNVTAPKFIGALQGNADTATTASKLGSTTIGGSAKPIYLSSGTPTACSATVGSTTVPVYMNAGTITQCSTTLGVSITGNAATATTSTKWNGYDIWVGTESQLPSSRSSTTIYIVTDA